MKRLILALSLLLGCATSMPHRPTVGQEICATACKMLGGKYQDMSEQERACYCRFEMPEHFGAPAQSRVVPGSESNYVQANSNRL